MPPSGFEPEIPASERPQTHTLDRAATGIGQGKFVGAGSVLIIQKIGKRNVLAEDKLDDSGARMETNHRTTLHRLAVYSAE